jgi:UDP-galactopyranose mutase
MLHRIAESEMKRCDVLIVGAGFSGLVMAERLSNELGKHCIVVDKRQHVGGNAYDMVDAAGVLIHPYGGHIFSTNSDKVFQYLSRFTEWVPAEYTVASYARGRMWSFPVNLTTYEQLVGHTSTTEEMEAYLSSVRIPIDRPRNSEEAILSKVGPELYELFYKGYVMKQWGVSATELDPAVCLRLPIRTSRNGLRFDAKHACMPAAGYTSMFNRLLKSSPKVEVIIGTEYKDFLPQCSYKHLVYTGPIDQFFDCVHGPLPYRTLRFEHESFGPEKLTEGFWQKTLQVNYPNDYDFTRIIEIKHATGQTCPNTTIVREYPEVFGPGREPLYPVLCPSADLLYAKYSEMAHAVPNTTFVGRLARYSYINMDAAVGSALAEFERLRHTL